MQLSNLTTLFRWRNARPKTMHFRTWCDSNHFFTVCFFQHVFACSPEPSRRFHNGGGTFCTWCKSKIFLHSRSRTNRSNHPGIAKTVQIRIPIGPKCLGEVLAWFGLAISRRLKRTESERVCSVQALFFYYSSVKVYLLYR